MEVSDIHKTMTRYDNMFTRNMSMSDNRLYDVYRFSADVPVVGNKTVCKICVRRINKDEKERKAYYFDYRKINEATSIAHAIEIIQKLNATDEPIYIFNTTSAEFEDLIRNYVALANKLIMLDKQEKLIKQIEGD